MPMCHRAALRDEALTGVKKPGRAPDSRRIIEREIINSSAMTTYVEGDAFASKESVHRGATTLTTGKTAVRAGSFVHKTEVPTRATTGADKKGMVEAVRGAHRHACGGGGG